MAGCRGSQLHEARRTNPWRPPRAPRYGRGTQHAPKAGTLNQHHEARRANPRRPPRAPRARAAAIWRPPRTPRERASAIVAAVRPATATPALRMEHPSPAAMELTTLAWPRPLKAPVPVVVPAHAETAATPASMAVCIGAAVEPASSAARAHTAATTAVSAVCAHTAAAFASPASCPSASAPACSTAFTSVAEVLTA